MTSSDDDISSSSSKNEDERTSSPGETDRDGSSRTNDCVDDPESTAQPSDRESDDESTSQLSENDGESQGEHDSQPASAIRKDLILGIGLFGAIAVAMIFAVLFIEADPELNRELRHSIGIPGVEYTHPINDRVMLWLCIAATLGLLVWAKLRTTSFVRLRKLGRVAMVVLVAMTLVGSFAYFYGARGVALRSFLKYHDTLNYFLGAKYFQELGYQDLYDCAVIADAEARPIVRDRDRIRDLRTYRYARAGERRERSQCRSNFSEQRWQEFRTDLDLWRSQMGRGLRDAVRDRGYHGTPVHTFFASGIANMTTVSPAGLTRATLVDILGICLLLGLSVYAFGARLGLLFAVFVFVNFGDRYASIGGSFLRYAWFVTLGCGFAMLRRGRHGWAGALIATSALLVVFPVFFFAGVLVKAAWGWFRHKTIERGHRRMVGAAIVTTLVLGVCGASYGEGLGNYTRFRETMDLHAGLVSSGRIGFGHNFLFRGEVTADDPGYSSRRKGEEFRELWLPHWGLVALLLALTVVVALRLDDVGATVLCGFALFFTMFFVVPYYYAIIAFLIWIWHDRARTTGGIIMISLLFTCMAAVHIAWYVTEFRTFVQSSMMTWTLTFYLVATLGYLAYSTGLVRHLRRGSPGDSANLHS